MVHGPKVTRQMWSRCSPIRRSQTPQGTFQFEPSSFWPRLYWSALLYCCRPQWVLSRETIEQRYCASWWWREMSSTYRLSRYKVMCPRPLPKEKFNNVPIKFAWCSLTFEYLTHSLTYGTPWKSDSSAQTGSRMFALDMGRTIGIRFFSVVSVLRSLISVKVEK